MRKLEQRTFLLLHCITLPENIALAWDVFCEGSVLLRESYAMIGYNDSKPGVETCLSRKHFVRMK
jgi:hypothetical protein